MKRKTKENKLSTGAVVGRILKDSLGILHWLLLATALSIGSAFLAMNAPEILGDLTNQIYDLASEGIAMQELASVFQNLVIIL